MRLNRAIQFGLIIAVSILSTGCGPKGDPTHCKIGIAKFKIPEGWFPTEGEGNVVVNLTREDDTGEELTSLISVEIVKPPVGSQLGDAAGVYAEKFQGEIQTEGLTVAGEKAIHVKIPKRSTLGPNECIVVEHAGHVCFINGGTTTESDILETLKLIASEWEWDKQFEEDNKEEEPDTTVADAPK